MADPNDLIANTLAGMTGNGNGGQDPNLSALIGSMQPSGPPPQQAAGGLPPGQDSTALAALMGSMQPSGQPQSQVATPTQAGQPTTNPQAMAALLGMSGEPTVGVQGGQPARDPNAPPTMAGRRPNIVNLISGLINPAHAQAAGERPVSRTDVFENFMGNFLNSFSQGLSAAGHGPGANLRALGAGIQAPYKQDVEEFGQRQQAQANQAALQREQAQTEQIKSMGDIVQTPYGPMTRSLAMKVLPSYIGAESRLEVQKEKGATAIRIAGIKEGLGIRVTPEMAKAAGRPELEGQIIGKSGLDSINKALTAQGKNIAFGDIGDGHVGGFNKSTGEKLYDFGKSQRVVQAEQGAYQRAYWQAKFGLTPTQWVDDDGTTHVAYMSKLDAAGMAPATNAFDISASKAGLNNYRDSLNKISDNMDVLDDPVQRGLVAQAMHQIGTNPDPNVWGAALASMTQSGLSDKSANLIAATLQAREFIGANRRFTGNQRGSEALVQRMISNVASPMNTTKLNRALIQQDLKSTDQIEKNLLAFQSGTGKKPPAPGQSTPKSAAPPKATPPAPSGGKTQQDLVNDLLKDYKSKPKP
jgi:hypothetical protein